MSDGFLYNTGPLGRAISVDASGRLLAANDPVGGLYAYAAGDTGRYCMVDASGRLAVSLDSGSTGESNTASNLGAGVQVFKAKSGVDLQFRSLVAGSGMKLVQGTNTITVHASGINNITAASGIIATRAGSSVEVKERILIAKPFKTISAASGATTVDLAQYNNYYIPLDNNITITLANPEDGAKYLFIFKQLVGNNTASFSNSNVDWVGGTVYTATAASGSKDFVAMVYCAALDEYTGQPGLNCS